MIHALFLVGILAELWLVLAPWTWRYRQFIVSVVVGLIGFWSGYFVVANWNIPGGLMLAISFYRLFSLLRIAKNRMASTQLLVTVRRTSLVLMLLHLVLYNLFSLDFSISREEAVVSLVSIQLSFALAVLAVTSRNLLKTKYHPSENYFSDKELPTVTVAIPARNETAELASCLQSVLSSNYPKLEVIVLDDCSLDRTPDIIRDFAQDGVRFIEGHQPRNHWLAKNQAYQQLSEAASGEFILFCGVDMRLGVSAVRELVIAQLAKKRDMVSVMPLRIGGGVRTSFVQPMRYWWEIALPRRFFNRPAVLSSCWLIKKGVLKKLGGFSAVSKSIIPEAYFARELIKTDRYAFMRADEHLDIRTVKSVEAQLSTALRMRYPQLRKRPENVLVLSVGLVAAFLIPFLLVAEAAWRGFDVVGWLALLTSALIVVTHYRVLSSTNPANSLIGLLNFPIVIITEIVLLHLSMYRYEFSTIEWKGRNICLPVMRSVSRHRKLS